MSSYSDDESFGYAQEPSVDDTLGVFSSALGDYEHCMDVYIEAVGSPSIAEAAEHTGLSREEVVETAVGFQVLQTQEYAERLELPLDSSITFWGASKQAYEAGIIDETQYEMDKSLNDLANDAKHSIWRSSPSPTPDQDM